MPLPPSAAATAAAGKLACDEALYQKWLAYTKEQNALLAGGTVMKDAVNVAKNGSAAATAGLAQAGMQLQDLQNKYGLTHEDLRQLTALGAVVMEMHPLDNPMMKGSVEMMRKMQANPQTKANADKFFQNAEDGAKKAEARGRQQFGDACMDLFSKHAPEVMDVQMATATAVLGGANKPH
jgi:hypothetical protein